MSRILLISLTIMAMLVFFTSCKKKSEETSHGTPSDDIVYTDISPDTAVTSVRSWQVIPYGSLPVPKDSSAAILLDLDQDHTIDISIDATTYYKIVSASNPEANYNFQAGISMGDKDSVAFRGISYGTCSIAKPFPADSVISDKSGFTRHAIIYSQGSFPLCIIAAHQGYIYYGFKLFRNGGYMFGWIQIRFVSMCLTIKAYAINRTIGRPVRAGQKQ
ncbi:MAG: hypothetical protein NT040_10830 [Bacteroidetes bacterium]|nr:hypothetical protein [Bacteroidota bacterium]